MPHEPDRETVDPLLEAATNSVATMTGQANPAQTLVDAVINSHNAYRQASGLIDGISQPLLKDLLGKIDTFRVAVEKIASVRISPCRMRCPILPDI